MNIELPRDAEGREIPLNVDALYSKDGIRMPVFGWKYIHSRLRRWMVQFLFDDSGCIYYPEDYYLIPTDSWEKLLEDLNVAGDARYQEACAYFHRDKDKDGCTSCPGGEDGCVRIAMRDIADRIRKLRGEVSEDETSVH